MDDEGNEYRQPDNRNANTFQKWLEELPQGSRIVSVSSVGDRNKKQSQKIANGHVLSKSHGSRKKSMVVLRSIVILAGAILVAIQLFNPIEEKIAYSGKTRLYTESSKVAPIVNVPKTVFRSLGIMLVALGLYFVGTIVGNALSFSTETPTKIRIAVFTLHGRRQALFEGTVERGVYLVPIAFNTQPAGFFVVELLLNGQIHRFCHLKVSRTGARVTPSEGMGKKVALTKQNAITDTLVFSLRGYETYRLPVLTLSGTYDAVLQPISNPYVAFGDIFCAFDNESTSAYLTPVPFDRGDSIYLNIDLTNVGGSNAPSVKCSLSTAAEYIELVQPVAGYNNIATGNTVTNLSWYKVVVSPNIPSGEATRMYLHISDSWGGSWLDSCEYTFKPFFIEQQVIDDDSIPFDLLIYGLVYGKRQRFVLPFHLPVAQSVEGGAYPPTIDSLYNAPTITWSGNCTDTGSWFDTINVDLNVVDPDHAPQDISWQFGEGNLFRMKNVSGTGPNKLYLPVLKT